MKTAKSVLKANDLEFLEQINQIVTKIAAARTAIEKAVLKI